MNKVLKTLVESESLRSKLLGHFIGIALLAMIFGTTIILVGPQRDEMLPGNTQALQYINIPGMDFGSPLHRSMFRETLKVFYPGQDGRNDSLLRTVDNYRQKQFSEQRRMIAPGLTWSAVAGLAGMFLQFVAVYAIVLGIIYLGAQRIAVYRFVKMKQHRESYLTESGKAIREFRWPGTGTEWRKTLSAIGGPALKAGAKGLLAIVLFSPAYVIAYSLKTTLDTSSLVFMIVLGVVSNGVLIHTANKFFTFLVAESRKGYVQTAVVKNLGTSYEWNAPGGIPLRTLVRVGEGVRSHVFRHIYLNARFQFIPALKEHASFLVTGLVIIEMALNIQGHLCYELLQRILYRQYDIAVLIIFGIFLMVKGTEIAVDIWFDRQRRLYGY